MYGLVYFPTFTIQNSTIHVGKYTWSWPYLVPGIPSPDSKVWVFGDSSTWLWCAKNSFRSNWSQGIWSSLTVDENARGVGKKTKKHWGIYPRCSIYNIYTYNIYTYIIYIYIYDLYIYMDYVPINSWRMVTSKVHPGRLTAGTYKSPI